MEELTAGSFVDGAIRLLEQLRTDQVTPDIKVLQLLSRDECLEIVRSLPAIGVSFTADETFGEQVEEELAEEEFNKNEYNFSPNEKY